MPFPEASDGSFGRVHFGGAPLSDPRHAARLVRVADQVLAHPGGTLPQKFPDPYQLDASYRLFAAGEVTHAAVIAAHCRLTHTRMAAARPVVLVLHDDTVLDYSGLDVPDLGPIGNGNGRGFVAHTALAVTPAGAVLGLAHQTLYRHPPKSAGRRRPGPAGRLWRDGMAAVPTAPAGTRYVHVADRAGDINELLDLGDLGGAGYVVRSQHDRACTVDLGAGPVAAKLHPATRTWPADGPGRPVTLSAQRGRPGRRATLRLAWRAVTLHPPRKAWGRERAVPLPVGAVRVWEPDPPAGVDPVEWLLLTNVPVADAADAWERVDWYARRPVIEEFHKAWKTGTGVELLQLTTRERLEPAAGLLAVVAVLLLALRDLGRTAAADTRATDWVPPAWVEVLARWRHRGPPRPDWTVREFLMALGRLGGHQNRPSDGPPGWMTLWRGWAKLQAWIALATDRPPPTSGGT